ncbi:1,3-beta-glucanosyltransferase GAS1 [Smittium culicis]|uniref:1,3-beta-glucanosyltransferase n=1 Tax=Smittium culicis TaxID=133412 RepID=A0A1R1XCV9_9FUNG|nr:1,3-beta-glucanosyltransferase GAS1 [Smittium culicis]
MKFLSITSILSLSLVAAIDPLTFKGSKIFNSKTGDQFYFKGIAYQPKKGATSVPLDPLADEVGCARDIANFKDLGINSIRVYEIDNSKNHDKCMNALSAAGIYVMLDLSTPNTSIPRDSPYWDTYLLNSYKLTIDAFSKYDNLAGFIIGNEITNDVKTVPASAFVKASLRDVKTYIKSKKLSIPVGYVDNDDEAIRNSLIQYFNCGDDPLATVDFYGINTYRWCGTATYKSSLYPEMLEPLANYSVPYLLTEYGCNEVTPRSFKEVASIYGPDMQDLTSGGFLFEYSNEPNNYGIVDVSFGSTSVTKLDDYDTFKTALSNVSPKGTTLNSYNPSLKPSTCPSVSGSWTIGSALPPSPNLNLCNCLSTTFSCSLPSAFNPQNSDQSTALAAQISYLCGVSDCSAISSDVTKGVYGQYSACTPIQKANLILSQYYAKNNNAASSCAVKNLGSNMSTNSSAASINNCKSISGNTVNSSPVANMGPDGLTKGGPTPADVTSPGSSTSNGSANGDNSASSSKSSASTTAISFVALSIALFALLL